MNLLIGAQISVKKSGLTLVSSTPSFGLNLPKPTPSKRNVMGLSVSDKEVAEIKGENQGTQKTITLMKRVLVFLW